MIPELETAPVASEATPAADFGLSTANSAPTPEAPAISDPNTSPSDTNKSDADLTAKSAPAASDPAASETKPTAPKSRSKRDWKLPKRIGAFFARNEIIAVTFGIAFVIMLFGFACSLMFPLGDRQIMVIDSWHQYYPFLQIYQHKLQHFGSLFYSHDIGLGTNFWLLMSYYLNSPINLLSFFFPSEFLREFMMIATALKVAFASAFFALFLRDQYRKNDLSVVTFSLAYGFSAYLMGYYWNIMWLDTVALLPLVATGMHRILRGERPLTFVFALALSIVSNYYIGYMTCLFVAFYYVYLGLTVHRAPSFKAFVLQASKMVFYSLIGVGLSAFVLLPTYRGMMLASSASFTFPQKFTIDRSILDVLNNMLVGNAPAVVRGLPNVYTGFLSIIMLYFYFRAPKIPLSEKIGSFLLLLFLVLGFNSNVLNFIWHGFHYPNEIPHRFSFVFGFFVVSLAYRGYLQMEEVKPTAILSFLGAALIYLIFGEKGAISQIVVYTTMFAAILYSSVIWQYRRGAMTAKTFAFALLLLVALESTASAITGVAVTGHSKRSSYKLYNQDIQAGLRQIRTEDPGDYRIEMARIYSVNDAALYGYRGAGCFTSTANANVTRFLQDLGVAGNVPSNRYSVTMAAPILDSMLGIKYFIGRNELGNADFGGKTEVFRSGHVRILRNDTYLPLAFLVSDHILEYEHESKSSPLAMQEHFLEKAIGERFEIYHKVPLYESSYDNLRVTSQADDKFYYSQPNSSTAGKATLTYVFPEDGDYTLYLDSGRTKNATVTIDDGTGNGERDSLVKSGASGDSSGTMADPSEATAVHTDEDSEVPETSLIPTRSENYEIRRGILIPSGTVKRGGKMTVRFDTDPGTGGMFRAELVRSDLSAFERAWKRLDAHTLRIDTMRDTYIAGQIHSSRPGYVYFSLPYEKGWTAKVNGMPVEITPLKNAMTLVPIKTGVNVVELSYMPDGFVLGSTLSLCSLIALLLSTGLPIRRKKIKNVYLCQ
ncbi:MAG: YfhO family protein [Bacillota bacterium]|nr:YfhO family protein [Bacillota bacterium]